MSKISAEFWAGVAERRLRLPWCRTCRRPHFPPRPFCPLCWQDELEWRDASGAGTLYSFTVVRANPPSAFRDVVPFTIGIVKLAEGVQLMAHVEGDVDELECDAPVELTWKELHERTLPAFRLLPSVPR